MKFDGTVRMVDITPQGRIPLRVWSSNELLMMLFLDENELLELRKEVDVCIKTLAKSKARLR